MASGQFDYIVEMKEKRVARSVQAEWGTGTFYNRLVTCPVGAVEKAKAGVLALGSVMIDRFWKTEVNETILQQYPDSEGVGPEVPRLFEVRERQPQAEDGVAVQRLELVYLAIDPKSGETVANGYVETARHLIDKHYTVEYDVWGIALTTASTGIPNIGDKLDGNTDNLGGVVGQIEYNDEKYPGRTLVHFHTQEERAYA